MHSVVVEWNVLGASVNWIIVFIHYFISLIIYSLGVLSIIENEKSMFPGIIVNLPIFPFQFC